MAYLKKHNDLIALFQKKIIHNTPNFQTTVIMLWSCDNHFETKVVSVIPTYHKTITSSDRDWYTPQILKDDNTDPR